MTELRTAVVIGGASGLGRATAHALKAAGFQVIVADRDAAGASAVAHEVAGVGCFVDITDEASVEAFFAEVKARDAAVHAVVNTAGINTWSPLVKHDLEEWRKVIDVNLIGAFLVLKHAGLVVADGGSLVSLTSLNARQPGYGLSAYCAAKAGLAMLTEVTALELAARRIRVNAISPGLVITPLTEAVEGVPGVVDDYMENTPLARAGEPEEVAAAVVFLCSDQAAWITGTVMDVNGGAHLMRYPDLGKHFAAVGLG